MTGASPISRIVVVGGGFSGAVAAVNVARLAETPQHVTVVNPERAVGRGVAYALRRPEFLLNVAARNMSAFPDQPDHFLTWLRLRPEFETVPEAALRERFIARQIYGDYLSTLVVHYLRTPGTLTPVTTKFVVGAAVDVTPGEGRCTVHVDDGTSLPADRVVLATGNEAPATLPGTEAVADHAAWVANPWQSWEHRVPPGAERIVVLGTGLTAVDVVVAVRTLGWNVAVHAVSRHGWLPHAHFRGIDYPDFPPADVDLTALGLEKLAELVETHCAALTERGANPAIVVDKLRQYTQAIWAGFDETDQRTFASRYAARWNVHRHRIAPEIHALLENGLHVHAGSIVGLEPDGARIRVRLDGGESVAGDLVINATGPSTRFTRSRSTLLQNLLRRGLIAPDRLDLGVSVDDDHVVRDGAGERSPWLLALGPLLRGTYWETVAVPEIRVQARRVAETLLGQTRSADDIPPLLEYMV
jgi:uncharacterized NAD(P)/FAD-binding protein YdhS